MRRERKKAEGLEALRLPEYAGFPSISGFS